MKGGAWGKVENHEAAKQQKTYLRRWLVSQLDSPRVLDCFSGPQAMRGTCYQDLPYVGIDKEKLGPDQYVGDTHRVLRAIDLKPFTLFDIDAYADPWSAWIRIVDRRKLEPGEVIGVAITCATLRLKFGVPSKIQAKILGENWWVPCGEAAELAIDVLEWRLAIRWGAEVVARRRFRREERLGMTYDALVLRRR